MGKRSRQRKKQMYLPKPEVETVPQPPPLAEPEVIIDRDVYNKIMHWVHKSTEEVSGLGTIVRLDNGDFRVVSAIMLPQKNTMGSTDIEGVDVAKAMYALREQPGTLNFWWHSHVNMDVFWSRTDTDTIQTFGDAGGQGGFVVSTVFNKKNQHRTAVYSSIIFAGKPLRVFVDDVKLNIVSYYPQATFDTWDEEYTKNVLPPKKHEYNGRGYGGDDFDHWGDPMETGRWDKVKNRWIYAPLKGTVTIKEKMLGISLQNVGTSMKKFPVDRNGYPVGPDYEPGVDFSTYVVQNIVEANAEISDAELNTDTTDRKQVMSMLSEKELDVASEIGGISEEEFWDEFTRRFPNRVIDAETAEA